jgi:hypothetical protein
MDILKFPVGKLKLPDTVEQDHLHGFIDSISTFPDVLASLISTFSDEELDTPYRPEGWTARQVIHHLADSHCHALMRFKWSLTEDKPTIKPYLEAQNALLVDYLLPVQPSLDILKGIHEKWATIMQHMESEDWVKGYYHPETGRFFRLDQVAAMYDWHCRHHLEHIRLCKKTT